MIKKLRKDITGKLLLVGIILIPLGGILEVMWISSIGVILGFIAIWMMARNPERIFDGIEEKIEKGRKTFENPDPETMPPPPPEEDNPNVEMRLVKRER